MAGVQSFEEEFLTCAICTDIYSDPCTLNCGHSFCRSCVTNFIKTRPEAVQSSTIPCAFCRQVTKVPNPQRPVEEWAGQLRPSLILQGLMDRHQSEHKHGEGESVCFLCKEVGETTPASSWCSDCEVTLCSRCAKRHPKAPSSRDHEVYDLSDGTKAKQRPKVKCREHEGEKIKYICKNCNKAACQKCCVLNHRACEHVVPIESMIPEIKSALGEKRRTLERNMKDNMAAVKNEENKIEQLTNAKTTIGSEIESAIEIGISLLRTKKRELLEKLGDVTDKQIAQHQANVKSGQITNQMYQQHCAFIDQALQSESEVNMYDMYQVCQSGAVESVWDTDSDPWNTPVVNEIKFTSNMEPLRKAITGMGTVDVSFLAEAPPVSRREGTHRPNTFPTPLLHDTIDIKHREDTRTPYPVDITVLAVNGAQTVVVADYSNRSLKSIYTKRNKKEISLLKLSSNPCRVVELTGNRVAATVKDSQIVVAEVKPELIAISKLKTSKQYTCLTSLPDSTLAVGSDSPPAVDILNLSGNVIRSFSSHNTGLNIIQDPSYLCTSRQGNILVSDWGSKSVYCLTAKGGIVFAYTPTGDTTLTDPLGIAVTDRDDVLLAEGKLKKIVHLSSDGIYVRDVLTSTDGVGEPVGVCVDDTNKLYVCGSSNVKAFNVKLG